MCMYMYITHILPLTHDIYLGQGHNEHGPVHFKASKY